jgi:hypothetical protein
MSAPSLRQFTQGVPRAAIEHTVARDDHRPLGRAQHLDRGIDRLGVGIRLGLGSVFGLVKEILELARVVEARPGYFRREVEVDRLGHTALELTECIAGVLPDTRRGDHPLAVLPDSLGARLLVGILDPLLRVLGEDRLVAGENQDGGSGGVGRRDRADHVGEARSFGPGRRRDLTGCPTEGIGGVTHRPFVASAIRGDPGVGDGVNDAIVARTTEQRLDALLLARAGEDLRAGHWEVNRGERRRLCGLELLGYRDRLDVFFLGSKGETPGAKRGSRGASAHDGVSHEPSAGLVGGVRLRRSLLSHLDPPAVMLPGSDRVGQ